jgi:hypothetical protein
MVCEDMCLTIARGMRWYIGVGYMADATGEEHLDHLWV